MKHSQSNSQPIRKVKDFYADHVATSGEQYDPEMLKGQKYYPSNYFRLEILKRRLASQKPERILDIGLGEGTPAVTLAKAAQAEVRGFDYTVEMVEKARVNFAANGFNADHVIQASIQDPASYAALLEDGLFDVALCLGVMPHITDVPAALQGIRATLVPGGRAFVSFRNNMFSLFTMNRFTHDFIMNELLADVPEPLREACSSDISARLAMDKPPLRLQNADGGVGYDAVRSQFNNPLLVPKQFAAAGFGRTKLHHYHFHPVPPMLENSVVDSADFRKAAMDMELRLAEDWRGIFLCSAYVVEAVAE